MRGTCNARPDRSGGMRGACGHRRARARRDVWRDNARPECENPGSFTGSEVPTSGMTSRRELAARLLERSGALTLYSRFGAPARRVAVLAYHRVLDRLDATPGDRQLVSATTDQLAAQIAALRRRANVIGVDELAAACRGDALLPPRPLLITFDDGFADNYSKAMPVLAEHGCAATFFVVTRNVDRARLFWFDWVVIALVRARQSSLRLDAWHEPIDLGGGERKRRRAASAFLGELKTVSPGRRARVLEELAQASGVPDSADTAPENRPMTWAELREMSDAGMTVGSHTRSHEVLAQLEPAALAAELSRSRGDVEDRIGRPCSSVAYPFGGDEHYPGSTVVAVDERVRRAAEAAGYEVGFTYVPGVNAVPRESAYDLRRLHMAPQTSVPQMLAQIALPGVFARWPKARPAGGVAGRGSNPARERNRHGSRGDPDVPGNEGDAA